MKLTTVERKKYRVRNKLKKVSNSEVENYMSRCRAFVYAGLEDFGIAPIEAMASSLPVVVAASKKEV